ncbi:MAG: SDR family NAD(P)-dependent oxidoreductase [Gemmatimonadota bacterium]
MQTLVTGGAGFIGSALARELVRLGHSVRVVDNLSTGFRNNLDELATEIEFVQGDLRSEVVCDSVTTGIDTAFHVAALPSVPRSMKDPIGSHDNNVNATVLLLEACRRNGVRRFVYSGSSSAYGDTPALPKSEEMEVLPRSPYAAAKLAGELYTLAYARAGLIEGIALRYFNVFGPRQDPNGPYAAVIPAVFRAAALGQLMGIHGDGLQTRDFTYVDNVVTANILAATRPAQTINGWSVNVGAGQQTTLLDLVTLIASILGKDVPVRHNPPRSGDVRDSLASLDRARTILGYTPKTSLREGLEKLAVWYAGNPGALAAVAARAG